MYGKPDCIYCIQAKNLLKKHNIQFNYMDLTPEHKESNQILKESKTVPQIFFGDHHVGGYRELRELEKKGELKKIIKQ